MLIALGVPEWQRAKVVNALELIVMFVAQGVMLAMYNPRTRFNASFPFHSSTGEMAEGRVKTVLVTPNLGGDGDAGGGADGAGPPSNSIGGGGGGVGNVRVLSDAVTRTQWCARAAPPCATLHAPLWQWRRLLSPHRSPLIPFPHPPHLPPLPPAIPRPIAPCRDENRLIDAVLHSRGVVDTAYTLLAQLEKLALQEGLQLPGTTNAQRSLTFSARPWWRSGL